VTAATRDALQQGLGGHYVLERELGHGGMATVYLARDTKHARLVALKVLNADLAASLGVERFRREIATAAQLQHPHILGVHDSGETPSGQLWFTMPYVEGESLRDRLRREGRLPIDDAVRITREVAGALDAAHAHGVIHRDIKPENILLTRQGDALLADFGIARALQQTADGPALTETGFAPGTPQYMSPEQAAGEVTLTPSSDVYGLGAVLYEMLTGEPPFARSTTQAVLAKILTTDAPAVRARRPEAGPALDSIVARALARNPSERFASAAALTHALSAGVPVRSGKRPRVGQLLTTALAVAAAISVAWLSTSRRQAEPGDARATGLAVLPFDLEGDTADAYVADGMTDEIRGKLAGLPSLRLIASASSNEYRHSTKPQTQIARELGVRYLLTGRVTSERAPNGDRRVRVVPELVEVQDGVQPAIRWQRAYDTTLADMFDLQTAVASRVVDNLGLVLTPAVRTRIEASPTKNPAAYDAFLHSKSAANDPATLRRALASAERAVAIDPSFAEAWANISMIHTKLFIVTHPTRAEADAARDAAERAVSLAPNAPAGYLARGYYARLVSIDLTAARAAYETVLRLAPSSVDANQGLASVEAGAGEWADALDHARRAAALDPRAPVALQDLTQILLWLRRYSEARATAERGLAVVPGDLDMIELRALSRLGEGDVAGARAGLRDVPSTLDRASLVAYVCSYWDLYWALDSADWDLAAALTPRNFDGERGTWAFVRSELYQLRHDSGRTRQYADTAIAAYDAEPPSEDFQRPLFRGLMLARLGQAQAAESVGARGVALAEASGDQFGPIAYAHHVMARIYVATGNHAGAFAQLDTLLAKPYFISPAWLRIDPAWAPLRGEARFQRLAGNSAGNS
jgi:eukaryotic-like serine/threonine-protein kinase